MAIRQSKADALKQTVQRKADSGYAMKRGTLAKPIKSYGPDVTLDDETENALVRASTDYEDAVRGDVQEDAAPDPRPPSGGTSGSQPNKDKASALRGEGFDGLAALEEMQTSKIGSSSSLSGEGSRRMITSPARSLESQARRYKKFGRIGMAAASALMGEAAAMRSGAPGIRTEGGIKKDQEMDKAGNALADSAIGRVNSAGNEIPAGELPDHKKSRRDALGPRKRSSKHSTRGPWQEGLERPFDL